MLWTAQDAADHAPRASGHLDSYHDRRRFCRAKRSFFRGSLRPVPAQGFRFRLKQPAGLISPRPRRIPSHPLCLLAGAEAKPAAFEVQRISISVELAASGPIAPAGEGPQVGRVAGERDAPGPDSTRAAVTPSSFSKGYLASQAIRIFFLSSAAQ